VLNSLSYLGKNRSDTSAQGRRQKIIQRRGMQRKIQDRKI